MPRNSPVLRHRRPWPLVAAGLLAIGNVSTIVLLPGSVARSLGAASLMISLGSLAVVLAYAHHLTDAAPSRRTVLLVGGPCDGRRLTHRSSNVPTEVWLADNDGAVSAYQLATSRRDRTGILRYRQPGHDRPVADC